MAVGIGAILGVLAWGGVSGRLRRNAVAGIRTSGTMSTDVAWRVGHRAAARWLAIGSVVAVACGVAALVAALSGAPFVAQALGWAGLAGVVAVIIPSVVVAERAARGTRR